MPHMPQLKIALTLALLLAAATLSANGAPTHAPRSEQEVEATSIGEPELQTITYATEENILTTELDDDIHFTEMPESVAGETEEPLPETVLEELRIESEQEEQNEIPTEGQKVSNTLEKRNDNSTEWQSAYWLNAPLGRENPDKNEKFQTTEDEKKSVNGKGTVSGKENGMVDINMSDAEANKESGTILVTVIPPPETSEDVVTVVLDESTTGVILSADSTEATLGSTQPTETTTSLPFMTTTPEPEDTTTTTTTKELSTPTTTVEPILTTEITTTEANIVTSTMPTFSTTTEPEDETTFVSVSVSASVHRRTAEVSFVKEQSITEEPPTETTTTTPNTVETTTEPVELSLFPKVLEVITFGGATTPAPAFIQEVPSTLQSTSEQIAEVSSESPQTTVEPIEEVSSTPQSTTEKIAEVSSESPQTTVEPIEEVSSTPQSTTEPKAEFFSESPPTTTEETLKLEETTTTRIPEVLSDIINYVEKHQGSDHILTTANPLDLVEFTTKDSEVFNGLQNQSEPIKMIQLEETTTEQPSTTTTTTTTPQYEEVAEIVASLNSEITHLENSASQLVTSTESTTITSDPEVTTSSPLLPTVVQSTEKAVFAAPEPRSLQTSAPHIERIFNSDGVEVLYGYSSVARSRQF